VSGAGYAIAISEMSNCILLYVLVSFTSFKEKFTEFSFKPALNTFKKMLPSYSKSSWSIVIHVYVDFFAFFLMNFVAT
jgi:Na+-driven multidrug efflux pump